jgi:hypothetical protein
VSTGEVSSLRVASDLDTTYVVYVEEADGGKVVVRKL